MVSAKRRSRAGRSTPVARGGRAALRGSGGIAVVLTRAQVDGVLREAADTAGVQGFLFARSVKAGDAARAVLTGPEMVDPGISHSALMFLVVVAYIFRAGGPCRVIDVAAALGLSPSTTHRYVRTAVQAGLLEQDERSRAYQIATEETVSGRLGR